MVRSISPLFLLLSTCAILAAPVPKGSWERVDPDRDCKIVIKDGTISMELPAGDHDFAPKRNRFNAPGLLREIEGDFKMQVRVCASFCPSAKSSVDGEDPMVAAGLVLMPVEKHCIRLEYHAYRRMNELESGPTFRIRGELYPLHEGGWTVPWKKQIRKGNEEHIYVRLDRRGNSIYQNLSPDGENWYAGSDTRPGVGTISVDFTVLPAKLKVGLAAYSTSTEPFKVRFDQFKLIRRTKKDK